MEEQVEIEQQISPEQQDQEQLQQNAPGFLPEQINTLEKLMKNKTAKEVARDLVYNKEKELSSLKKKYGQNSQMNSQQSSQQYGKGSNYIQSYIQRSILQNQTSSQYEGQQQDQSSSILTKISQKLYQDLPKGKEKYQGACEQPFTINHQALRTQKDKGAFSQDIIEKTQGELLKEQHSLKEQQNWYQNSVIGKQNYVQQKKIALIEEQKEKELQECTFQPKILPAEEREQYFWEKQGEVQKMYDEKKEQLSKQVNNQQNSNYKKKPEISKETNQLADQHFKKNNINKPVFDRLYQTKNTYANASSNPFIPSKNDSNEKMIQIQQIEQNQTQSAKKIKPQSAITSGQRRDNLLYLDAKRRQEQKQQSSKKKEEKQEGIQYQSVYPNKNLISKFKKEEQYQTKVLSKKSNLTFNQMFLKEILNYIKQIRFPDNQFENDEMYLDESISNEDYYQIMQLLRFISIQYQGDGKSIYIQEQENLLNDIWELLDKMNGEVKMAIIRDFIVVLTLFINFKMIEKGDFKNICQLVKEIIPSVNSVFQKIFKDNNYKNSQLLNLSKRFQTFCQNRLHTSTNTELKEGLQQEEEEKYSYHPQISQISVSLANKKKEQIKNEINELQNEINEQNGQNELKDYDQNLLLGYQKLKSDQEKEKMRKEMEYMEMSECTFQPNCFKGQNYQLKKQIEITQTTLGVKKSEELHAQASIYHQSKKVQRNTYDIEYEKNCDQCTFQPDIHFYQSTFSTSSRINPTMHSEDSINKNINRIKEARHKKLLEEQIKQTGHTMNDNKRTVQKQTVELQDEQYITSLREHKPQGASFQQNKQTQKSIQQQEYSQQFSSTKKQPQSQIQPENYHLQNTRNFVAIDQGKEADHLDNNNEDNLDEPAPLLFVDVNIEEGQASRIIVREGDTAPQLAANFAREHNLDSALQQKLEDLLEQQIKNLLTKIEEEEEISENPNQFT